MQEEKQGPEQEQIQLLLQQKLLGSKNLRRDKGAKQLD